MKITREGKRFILAAVLIAVAAVNTGNNLIYLILSLMLSFVLLSIMVLRTNLSGISLGISLDQPVFAGEQTTALFTIENRKKLIPAYSVHITAAGVSSPLYVVFIAQQNSVQKQVRMTFAKRGLYSYGDFTVRSGFPFILFEKSSTMKVSGEVLVYPALMEVERLVSDIRGREGIGTAVTTGTGDEIHSLRDFRYGDDWRKIHWKASAKASNLMVKEYALADIRKITIILDNLLPAEETLFEKNLSLAGSLVRYFLDDGYFVRVLSCKKVIPFGSGEEHFFKVLDILALMREENAFDCPLSEDREGYTILLLKSGRSSFNQYVSSADMVMYADSL